MGNEHVIKHYTHHIGQILLVAAVIFIAALNGKAFADQGTFMGVVGSFQKNSGGSAAITIIIVIIIIMVIILIGLIRRLIKAGK